MTFHVYILECSDGTFYTGYTSDLMRRLGEHNHGSKGARYTKARRPVKLIHHEEYKTRSEAMKRENEIKKLSHDEKGELANNE